MQHKKTSNNMNIPRSSNNKSVYANNKTIIMTDDSKARLLIVKQ